MNMCVLKTECHFKSKIKNGITIILVYMKKYRNTEPNMKFNRNTSKKTSPAVELAYGR